MKKISIIIPIYNESKNIPLIHAEVNRVFDTIPHYDYEIIFVNDGSKDNSSQKVKEIMQNSPHVTLLDFSRNFGKEEATSAGLHRSTGDAVICLDADLQHPPKYIPEFISKWEAGDDVIIGVRTNNASDSVVKKIGSYFYYKIINSISETEIIPRATDFRLIDRQVVDEFNLLTERNRMTRGLIDWLGFKRSILLFEASDRLHGEAGYSTFKLIKLATESFISHSLFPLRLAGYIGMFILPVSGILGIVMFIDRYVNDLGLRFSGPAMLANVTLFLVGIVLVSIGLLAYYIGHIFEESQNRQLYVIRKERQVSSN
jgi:dolichol-phosphate mannosyltransferase